MLLAQVDVNGLSHSDIAVLALLALILAALGMLLVLRLAVPVLVDRLKNPSGEITDAWLTITKDLVEQIKRSVDNQTATSRQIATLTETLIEEIHGSEARIVAALDDCGERDGDRTRSSPDQGDAEPGESLV